METPGKVVKFWLEPTAFRRYRHKLVRKNQLKFPLHLWLIFGILTIAAGIGIACYYRHKTGNMADKGMLIALLGVFLTIARFTSNIICNLPMAVTFREKLIIVMNRLPGGTNIWLNEKTAFNIKSIDLSGRTYEYVDIIYRVPNGGLSRQIFALPTKIQGSEIRQLLEERNITYNEDLDQIVPDELMGAGEILETFTSQDPPDSDQQQR